MIWNGDATHERLFKTAGYKSEIDSVDHESTKTSRAVSDIETERFCDTD